MSAQHTFTALARPKSLHHRGTPAFELVGRPDGAFHLRADSGLMRAADGVYNFVRIQGAHRNQSAVFVSARLGHAALAQGQPVLYAGTLSVRQGVLSWWSNFSGTYQPSPHFRTQARLPDDKFIPWQKLAMGGVGLQRGMLSDHRPAGAPARPKPGEIGAARPKAEENPKPAVKGPGSPAKPATAPQPPAATPPASAARPPSAALRK